MRRAGEDGFLLDPGFVVAACPACPLCEVCHCGTNLGIERCYFPGGTKVGFFRGISWRVLQEDQEQVERIRKERRKRPSLKDVARILEAIKLDLCDPITKV